MKNKFIITSFLQIICCVCFAQEKDTTESSSVKVKLRGNIADKKIVIEKDKIITLPTAERIAIKRNLTGGFDQDSLRLTFEKQKPNFDWPTYKYKIDFEYPDFIRSKYRQNYVKLGFGNFLSFLLDAGFYKNLAENIVFKTGLMYEGYFDDRTRNSGQLTLDASARIATEKLYLTPRISLTQNNYRFYGNTSSTSSGDFSGENASRGLFEKFKLSMPIKTRFDILNIHTTPEFIISRQLDKNTRAINQEQNFNLLTRSNFKIDSTFYVGLDIAVHLSKYSGSADFAYKRSLTKFSPWASYKLGNFDLYGGFTLASSTDYSSKKTGFFPFVWAHWNFMKNGRLYAKYESDIRWKNLADVLEKNPFLDSEVDLRNEKLNSSITFGVEGTFFEKVNATSQIRFDNIDDNIFFVPQSLFLDSSKFILGYDTAGEISRTSLMMDINYANSTDFIIGLNVVLNNYTLNQFQRAWYVPVSETKFYISYNVFKKLNLLTVWHIKTGIYAPDRLNIGAISLNNILDINLEAQYDLGEKLSAFGKLNNILGKNYQNYSGYPVRGLNFKLGVKYRF